ncbi:MAG: pseudouridine-5'-phosphate glycosidase [Planctomycetota bacterium]
MRVHTHPATAPVALESTLLLHGVPRDSARPLTDRIDATIRAHGATPMIAAVFKGAPTLGLSNAQLDELLEAPDVPKANTANLGLAIHSGRHAATTVSTTMEIAAAAGVRTFATGGLGGVHKGYDRHLDVSADLAALARHPVAVVAAGVKSLLDVVATREALESLGVPVIGFRTDAFPAFYLERSEANVDARFDEPAALAAFLADELTRTGRGVLVVQPPPREHAIHPARFESWLRQAEQHAGDSTGRDVTPDTLAALHELSDGATLRTNIELVVNNTKLAAQLAACMEGGA